MSFHTPEYAWISFTEYRRVSEGKADEIHSGRNHRERETNQFYRIHTRWYIGSISNIRSKSKDTHLLLRGLG